METKHPDTAGVDGGCCADPPPFRAGKARDTKLRNPTQYSSTLMAEPYWLGVTGALISDLGNDPSDHSRSALRSTTSNCSVPP
jgi:hypothetical protein